MIGSTVAKPPIVLGDGIQNGTAGSVLFLDGDGALSEDNPNLSYASEVLSAKEIHVNDTLLLGGDSRKILFGTGSDMSAYYDGTGGVLKTNEVAASDLHFITGTGKTLVLDNEVYEDLNFDPSSSGGPAVSLPDFVVINGVIHREFTSANNQLCGSGQEIPHHYKLSTQIYPHCHVFLRSGQAVGTTGATFTMYWEMRETDGTLTSGNVPLTATSANLTAYPVKLDIYDSTGFAGADTIGAQLYLTIARTAGNAGDTVLLTYGVHYAIDTMGSRTISSK